MNGALQRFPMADGEIKQVHKMEETLRLRNVYLLDDGSFWVILDEADIFGADFGFLHEGEKPASSYRILANARPMPTNKGWHMIRF